MSEIASSFHIFQFKYNLNVVSYMEYVMVISGRYIIWDINVPLQQFAKQMNLSTIYALNIPDNEIIPKSFSYTYNINHINRNNVFEMKLLL